MNELSITFYDVVMKNDINLYVLPTDKIWSVYKKLKTKIFMNTVSRIQREYTMIFDGEVLNKHNCVSDYNITDNSTIIILQRRRQARFTESKNSLYTRSSITPLISRLPTSTQSIFSRRRMLPRIPQPPPSPPPRSFPPLPLTYSGLGAFERRPRISRSPELSEISSSGSYFIPPGIIGPSSSTPEPSEDINPQSSSSTPELSEDINPPGLMVVSSPSTPELTEDVNSSGVIVNTLEPAENIDSSNSPPPVGNISPIGNETMIENASPVPNSSDTSNNFSMTLSLNSRTPLNDLSDIQTILRNVIQNQEQLNDIQHVINNIPENNNLPTEADVVVTFYRSVYSQQIQQLINMGYSDENRILEALLVNHGDILAAIDWLQE